MLSAPFLFYSIPFLSPYADSNPLFSDENFTNQYFEGNRFRRNYPVRYAAYRIVFPALGAVFCTRRKGSAAAGTFGAHAPAAGFVHPRGIHRSFFSPAKSVPFLAVKLVDRAAAGHCRKIAPVPPDDWYEKQMQPLFQKSQMHTGKRAAARADRVWYAAQLFSLCIDSSQKEKHIDSPPVI
jgi:hypothetical protein